MQQIAIFCKDDDNSIVEIARVNADGFSVGRAMWNTDKPNQHGTEMLWQYDADRHLVVSIYGILLIDSAFYTVTAGSFVADTLRTVILERTEPREMPLKEPLFPLGSIVGTPAALAAIADAGEAPTAFLARHVRGDWGDVCADDKVINHVAIKLGNRILSAYETGKGIKLWVITEADRASTTLLLPNEY